MQDLQAEGAPGGVPLLPAMRLQEGHLRHVRGQDHQHKGVQAEQRVIMGGLSSIGMFVYYWKSLLVQ